MGYGKQSLNNKEIQVFKKALIMIGLTISLNANASLIGDVVGCSPDFQSPNLICSPSSTSVGNSTEFTVNYNGGDHFYFDLDENSITITASPLANPGIGWGFTITDIDWNGNRKLIDIDNFFSNVGPLSPSDPRFPTGVIKSDILVGSDYIHLDLSTSTWEAGDYVSFDLVSELPAPASVWLFSSAFLSLAWFSRKKNIRK